MVDRDGVVEGLAVVGENADGAVGFEAGSKEDVLEELGTDMVGTGAGEEEGARGHLLDGGAVEIFIGSKGFIDVLLLLDEGGWVEDDEVVGQGLCGDEADGVFG